jgi:hypothetical protein
VAIIEMPGLTDDPDRIRHSAHRIIFLWRKSLIAGLRIQKESTLAQPFRQP